MRIANAFVCLALTAQFAFPISLNLHALPQAGSVTRKPRKVKRHKAVKHRA